MKVTVIKDNKFVSVNGHGYALDETDLLIGSDFSVRFDQICSTQGLGDFHAIQVDGLQSVIEMKDLSQVAMQEAHVNAWADLKADVDAAVLEFERLAQVEAELQAQQEAELQAQQEDAKVAPEAGV